MSEAGRIAKKKVMENYFLLHPDSMVIDIQGEVETFPALFDYAYMHNNRDAGNVEQQKRVPHLTLYSGFASLLKARQTILIIDGTTYNILQVKSDLTEGTFQTEAWLQ